MKESDKISQNYIWKLFYIYFRINTRYFVYLGVITTSCITLSSLCMNLKSRKLTYRAWLPFDYSPTLLFYLTYSHQLISQIIAGFLNVACDTLICGLLVHICCQIEILAYRLRRIKSYSDILRDCVRQHYHIFRLSLTILQILQVFIQYLLIHYRMSSYIRYMI